jgi:hypothetical protein
MKKLLLSLVILFLTSKISAFDDKIHLIIYIENCKDSVYFSKVLNDPELCECFTFDFIETKDPDLIDSSLAYHNELLIGQLYGKFNKKFLLMIAPKLECTAEDFRRRSLKRTSMNEQTH